ncbi:hypothetical protein ACOMHN_042678 [Nucella lapillus]
MAGVQPGCTNRAARYVRALEHIYPGILPEEGNYQDVLRRQARREQTNQVREVEHNEIPSPIRGPPTQRAMTYSQWTHQTRWKKITQSYLKAEEQFEDFMDMYAPYANHDSVIEQKEKLKEADTSIRLATIVILIAWGELTCKDKGDIPLVRMHVFCNKIANDCKDEIYYHMLFYGNFPYTLKIR